MPGWRVAIVPGVLLWVICSLSLLTGCGSGGSEQEAEAALPSYPSTLSAGSSPRQVAEVLIRALDQEDGQTLLGLVAVKQGASDLDAIYARYGKESERSPAQVAGLAVTGWQATYGWFQAGATQVTGESIAGGTATVEARGVNPNTGGPRLLQIEMVSEDGLWKVKPGLQSGEL